MSLTRKSLGAFMGLASLFLTTTLLMGAAVADQGVQVGNPKAPKGGTFKRALSAEPTDLNPFSSTDLYSRYVQEYVLDSLMSRNEDTNEWQPNMIESHKISKDGKEFTFVLKKGLKFHDGKPVTSKDVKFSFDAIRDPKYQALNKLPYFENIKGCEIVDDLTVKFTAKNTYFNNFNVVAGLTIVPMHVYKNKKMNKKILGSGPYKFGKYKKGRSIELVRNKDWWGFSDPQAKSMHNFDKVSFRFIKEENKRLEMLKKGRIDLVGMSPEKYTKYAVGKPWGKTAIKEKVENKEVKGYGFVGWNQKSDLFKDKNVRVALAHLMNRELMNKKFRFGMSLLATGPWYQQSPYAPKISPFGFNSKKAQALLAKAGWKDSDKDGILDKKINGEKKDFRFTLMFPNKDTEKYFTMYKQDLRKAGIDVQLKIVEWNSFIKALDERKFDAVSLGWGGGSVDNDPKQIWHSSSAGVGGSNFISYNNPKVDKLIDKGRMEPDRSKRIKIYNEIYKQIAADAPYAFMFNDRFVLYAHTSRMKMSKPTLGYSTGHSYWWTEK